MSKAKFGNETQGNPGLSTFPFEPNKRLDPGGRRRGTNSC